ncbi:MAG: hypothetical protein MZV65_47740 [Chromatiales bacterium]|nr:hypothetical protein [Chromatiales bacterium]MCK7582524.1 hypothetical protein [Chromatiales bacterium]
MNLAKVLEAEGDTDLAQKVLDDFCKKTDFSGNVCLQSLLLSCAYNKNLDQSKKVEKIIEMLKTANFDNWLSEIPERLYAEIKQHDCKGLDKKEIRKMAQSILENKRYNHNRVVVHNMHVLFAYMDIDAKKNESALNHLDIAVSANMNLITLDVAVRMAKDLGRNDLIEKWMSHVRQTKPSNPVKAKGWKIYINKINEIILND